MKKDDLQWFAMRDIKRPNDPNRAYKVLAKKGFEVFTPIECRMVKVYGRRYVRVEKALFPDILFVHTTRSLLDKEVAQTPTLSYRLRIGASKQAKDGVIIIDDVSMLNFQIACDCEIRKEFLKPDEIDVSLIGRKVQVFCNSVPGKFVGNLLRIKGRGLKVLVELDGLLRMKLSLSKNDLVRFVDGSSDKEDGEDE